MLLLKIHLLPFDTNNVKDDIIEVSRPVDVPHDMLSIEYIPSKGKTHQFWLNRRDTENYLVDTIESLTHDTDPWDKIQITPMIGPAVLYHISDLDDSNVRRCLLNICHMLFLADITITR